MSNFSVGFLAVFKLPSSKIPATAVRLGMIELDSINAEDYAIEKFIVHESYKSSTKQNDIAVAKLIRDVEFRLPQRIRPSCLWQDKIIRQSKTIAIGWGATAYGALGITDELMKVQLDILDNSLCAENFEETGLTITNGQVCAGVLDGGKDTCTGGKSNIPELLSINELFSLRFGRANTNRSTREQMHDIHHRHHLLWWLLRWNKFTFGVHSRLSSHRLDRR